MGLVIEQSITVRQTRMGEVKRRRSKTQSNQTKSGKGRYALTAFLVQLLCHLAGLVGSVTNDGLSWMLVTNIPVSYSSCSIVPANAAHGRVCSRLFAESGCSSDLVTVRRSGLLATCRYVCELFRGAVNGSVFLFLSSTPSLFSSLVPLILSPFKVVIVGLLACEP